MVALRLPGTTRGLPPYGLPGIPPAWLVVTLTAAGLVAGGLGLLAGLAALRAGWRPDTRRWVAGSVAATLGSVLVAPAASGDPLVYAAYGRLATLGLDPYEIPPRALVAIGDPVGRATEPPWQDVTSVYGPLATAVQRLAGELGGASMHQTVFWLAVANAVAWLGAGALLFAAAGSDRLARARVLVLVGANPLLLWAVPYGGHNDAQALVFAVGALLALRLRRAVPAALASGVLIGLAGTVKLTEGIVGLGLLWALRRRPAALVALCAAAAAVLAAAYVPHLPEAFQQTSANGGFVSSASPWRWVRGLVDLALTGSATRHVVTAASWALVAVVAVLLLRRLRAEGPAADAGAADVGGARCREAAAAVVAVTLAWVVAGAYTLPWYDAVSWAPVALLAGSTLDVLLLVRTGVVCLAYVATRQVPVAEGTGPVTGWIADRVRDTVSPVVHIGLVVALLRWGRGRDGRALVPFADRRPGHGRGAPAPPTETAERNAPTDVGSVPRSQLGLDRQAPDR